MIANYYTLRHIALQLDQQLKGRAVSEAFSQNSNELILGFDSPSSSEELIPHKYVIVSCEPSQNFIYWTESFARAKRNSIDLFKAIVGESVRSISIYNDDRQIAIGLQSGQRLMIQIFGSKGNVLLLKDKDEIADAFLRTREIVGTRVPERPRREAFPEQSAFLEQLRNLGEISIGVALKKFLPRFGTTLLTELIHRAGMNSSETVDRLSDEEMERLFKYGRLMLDELEAGCKPQIYYEDGNAIVFSIIDLQYCQGYEKKEFNSLSEAIRVYIGAARKVENTTREEERIHQGVSKELERITRTLAKIAEESESTDRAGRYEWMGEMLKAHLHELHKGMTEAILENTLDGSNEIVSIPLDQNLTPAKNADRYFDKAKRSRTAVAEKKKQTSKLEDDKRLLATVLQKLDSVASSPEFDEFLEEYHDVLKLHGLANTLRGKKKVEQEVPFRVFRVTGDFVVWAGKSGENNDLLSTRHTRPRDLWFHARAVGGSHVVLKVGTGKGEISKHAINEAAAIAAYYSKMKNSKLVPVSMCEGKYVRKPKGAPAGTVTIEREKVIFVEPGLPQGQ